MTLRRRLILHVALSAVGATALAAAVVAGVGGLRQDFGVALQANTRLRDIYEVGLHVASAKRWLREEPASPARAAEELRVALFTLERPDHGSGEVPPAAGQAVAEIEAEAGVERVRTLLNDAVAQIGQVRDHGGSPIEPAEVSALDEALSTIATLSARTRTVITDRQRAADAKHRVTQVAVAVLFALTVAGVVVAGARLYRAVTRPVNRLGVTARHIAAGRRDERVAATADDDAEFASLARDFNHMAAELDGLCNDLERQVAAKSKELVRSERLASVGFLAAGVAHEINNPLGIIAGYGERALQHLRRAAAGASRDAGDGAVAPAAGGAIDAATAERVGRSIEVMCEEAFRCKGITQRLLSLARGGAGEAPRPVCLATLAREVVGTVGALGDFADRSVTVEAASGASVPSGDYVVAGNDAELKQVILNLLINALQAVGPMTGRVVVTVRRDGGMVELAVQDNGRGMTAETLERAFEPFFSDRRGNAGADGVGKLAGTAERGTGLGLSITHAIVEDHAGTLRAESDGPGHGSRFVVRLPACVTDGAGASSTLEILKGVGFVRA